MTVTSSKSLSLLVLFLFVLAVALAAATILEEALPVLTYGVVYLPEDALF